MRHLMEICMEGGHFLFSLSPMLHQCHSSPSESPQHLQCNSGQLMQCMACNNQCNLAQLTKCMQQTSKCKKYDVMERIQPRPKTSLLASTAHLLPLTRVPSFRLTQVTASLCPINLGDCSTCRTNSFKTLIILKSSLPVPKRGGRV